VRQLVLAVHRLKPQLHHRSVLLAVRVASSSAPIQLMSVVGQLQLLHRVHNRDQSHVLLRGLAQLVVRAAVHLLLLLPLVARR
jgi:hypothetical protein